MAAAASSRTGEVAEDDRERQREYCRRYRARLKQDPVRRQWYRERQRLYDQKYHAKRKKLQGLRQQLPGRTDLHMGSGL